MFFLSSFVNVLQIGNLQELQRCRKKEEETMEYMRFLRFYFCSENFGQIYICCPYYLG